MRLPVGSGENILDRLLTLQVATMTVFGLCKSLLFCMSSKLLLLWWSMACLMTHTGEVISFGWLTQHAVRKANNYMEKKLPKVLFMTN